MSKLLSHQSNISAFRVTINSNAFNNNKPASQQRLKQQIIPKYWKKFNMDQKKIAKSKEDRLCQLTTKQIDRIIDMQKIKSYLHDKKCKIKDTYFDPNQLGQNCHSNVYQASFLAKINDIAIRRNIVRQSSVGFDQYCVKRAGIIKQKQQNNNKSISYRYSKTYRPYKQNKQNKCKSQLNIDDFCQNIEQFDADIQDFENKLKSKSCNKNNLKTNKQKVQRKLLPASRWCYGMSGQYLKERKVKIKKKKQEIIKQGFDISAQINVSLKNISGSMNHNIYNCKQTKYNQAFDKFKISRLVTIE